MKTLQKFASIHANISNHFNRERHLVDRPTYKMLRSDAGLVRLSRLARSNGGCSLFQAAAVAAAQVSLAALRRIRSVDRLIR
jgi:hypothetical protein